MNGHAIDITWSGFKYGTIEPYAYLLDFDSFVALTRVQSTATVGVRFQGAYDLIESAAKIRTVLESLALLERAHVANRT